VADLADPASRRRRKKRRSDEGVWYPRWFWPSFAAPASLYLAIFFALPLYVIVSLAFGTVDVTFQSAVPVYQPWFWTSKYLTQVIGQAAGYQRGVYVRTFFYVVIASLICVFIAYSVAYYVARFGGKRKGLFLTLLIAPFFVSYLMRMLAWINLLQTDGYINKILGWIPFVPHKVNWLGGYPGTVVLGLVYGYIPYMILMFGDYYTNNLLSGSPKTQMLGNLLDSARDTTGQGPLAAVLVLVLMIILLVPMGYYLRSTSNELKARSA